MRPKKQIAIVVSVAGGAIVVDALDVDDLRSKLPRNALTRQGRLFGVPVWLLKTTLDRAQRSAPNGVRKLAMSM